MTLGPIFSRELLVAARSARTYSTRALLVFGFLAGFCAVYEGYRLYYGRELSVQIVATMARQTFYVAVAVQGLATLMIIPQLVCGAIAREKDGKTLGFLLGTPLGSAEIILGKLASRLFGYLAAMAALAPSLFLLTLLGGIEPAGIALAYAATFSTAVTLGAFSILASTLCRGTKQATQLTTLFICLWVFFPFVLGVALRVLPPGWLSIFSTYVDWTLASSPLFATKNIFPIIFAGAARVSWLDDVLKMMGLQAILSSTFVALAVWRLRPSYRDEDGSSRRTLLQRLKSWRWRFLRRPPVGDSPIFWRETSTSTTNGFAKLLGSFLAASVAAILAYHALRFAIPAASEALSDGYRGGYDASRHRFGQYLRSVTAGVTPLLLAIVCGAIGTSVPSEKERDTWLGLIATPLSGREILGAKRLAPLFAIRFAAGGLAFLWLLGLAAGALHPIGFLLGLALVASWTTLAVGIGSWFSTRIVLSGNASGSAAGILVLLWVIPPLFNSYPPLRSMISATTCLPWLAYIVLLSYPDASILLRVGAGGGLPVQGVLSESSRLLGLGVIALGIVVPGLIGWFLIRRADSSFDRLAGRAIRGRVDPS